MFLKKIDWFSATWWTGEDSVSACEILGVG